MKKSDESKDTKKKKKKKVVVNTAITEKHNAPKTAKIIMG